MKRRTFLKASCLTGGSFLLSLNGIGFAGQKQKPHTPLLQSIVQIDPDNTVTIFVYKQEMGHGIKTGLAMIVAEELDADWDKVKVKSMTFSKEDKHYKDEFGRFDTGGSYSVISEWDILRKGGATARLMLLTAAAKYWNVAAENCKTDSGRVINTLNGQHLLFGELAELAARQTVPDVNAFKPRDQYRILGQPKPDLKNIKVATGELKYSIDEQVPGMLYAAMIRPPTYKGKIKDWDGSEARKVKGIVDIVEIPAIENDWVLDRGTRGGIAVVGTSTWACLQAKNKLRASWELGPHCETDCDQLYDQLKQDIEGEVQTSFKAGNMDKALRTAHQKYSQSYTTPFIAHGLMEPLNAIADFSDGKHLEIWAGTQSPGHSSHNMAKAFGIDKSAITLHPYPMGGGYGRRYFCDYLVETALISKAIKKPVKLTWTREDEIQVGAYHPMRKDYISAGLDKDGNIDSFSMAAISCHQWAGGEMHFDYGHNHIDINSKQFKDAPIVVGSWRAVVAHIEMFTREVFIDELAYLAKRDPLEYRISQMQRPIPTVYDKYHKPERYDDAAMRKSIYVRLLKEVEKMSDWHRPRPENVGLGIGMIAYHADSFAVMVAEVRVIDDALKILHFYCAADVGLAVNPNLIEGQIESSILWGITPVLHGGVDVVKGQIAQSSFHDMPLTRMHECPEISIKLFDFEQRGPKGAGEFAVVPVAPAISNAIFAATGKRHRHLFMNRKPESA